MLCLCPVFFSVSFSSVLFSRSVVSDSLWPHGLQHIRLPCPLPTSRAYSSSCPSSQVMPSDHLILCRPLFLQPSIFPSIRVFSNESVLLIRWPKYRSFSFSISPSNEYSRLTSFRMNWLDLLAVWGTLPLENLGEFRKFPFFYCWVLYFIVITIYLMLHVDRQLRLEA